MGVSCARTKTTSSAASPNRVGEKWLERTARDGGKVSKAHVEPFSRYALSSLGVEELIFMRNDKGVSEVNPARKGDTVPVRAWGGLPECQRPAHRVRPTYRSSLDNVGGRKLHGGKINTQVLAVGT